MEFSIIIPVLDEAKYLESCLATLSSQKYPREHYEIIAIDNGSTDGSLDILERWPEIRVLHESKRDAYAARNRGIEAAKGRVIAFTDADCEVSADWLQRLHELFLPGKADVVVGRLAYPVNASALLKIYADYYDTKTRWLFEAPLNECLYGHGGNMALRAKLFARVGSFLPSPWVGDTEILHRLLAHSEPVSIAYAHDLVAIHMEVETLRAMLPKLRRYGGYAKAVSQASSYRTLTLGERIKAMRLCARDNHYGVLRWTGLIAVLLLGVLSFEFGRYTAADEKLSTHG